MQRTLFDASDAPINCPRDDEITRVKQLHYGMVLMFRVGDYCQVFDEDATLASQLLGLELRSAPRPVASFPVESLEAHLRKLLHAGHRVAVCDA
jgi:DNA mismatch repair protein MutS